MAVHVLHLCETSTEELEIGNGVSRTTLLGLLRMLASKKAFNNVFLRHRLYCILQVVAGRLDNILPFICYIILSEKSRHVLTVAHS